MRRHSVARAHAVGADRTPGRSVGYGWASFARRVVVPVVVGLTCGALLSVLIAACSAATARGSGVAALVVLGGPGAATPGSTSTGVRSSASTAGALSSEANPRVVASRAFPPATTTGCAAALAYLRVHAAPGFTLSCPGFAYGHQAMTCNHNPQVCPRSREIVIADPCPAAYMNEASNSWVLLGLSSDRIDPYGVCRP
jgi:hypothetical protein